jgi:hypothetical protein
MEPEQVAGRTEDQPDQLRQVQDRSEGGAGLVDAAALLLARLEMRQQQRVVDRDRRLGRKRRRRLELLDPDGAIRQEVIDRQHADDAPPRLERDAGIGADTLHPGIVQQALRPGQRLQVIGQEERKLAERDLHQEAVGVGQRVDLAGDILQTTMLVRTPGAPQHARRLIHHEDAAPIKPQVLDDRHAHALEHLVQLDGLSESNADLEQPGGGAVPAERVPRIGGTRRTRHDEPLAMT